MKVLLTGSSGFVGKNLQKHLRFQFDTYKMKLDQEVEVASDVQAIVHLAGKAHDLRDCSSSDEYYQVNYSLTAKLYDAFQRSEATKFIFISSVKAVADRVESILTEDHVPESKTHYGKSKLMAEEYIRERPHLRGKSYYILRPCMVHGPGNKGNLSFLNKFISKGIPYPLASFVNRRSFLSVENLCFIINEIIERDDIPSGIYNVADDDPLSTNELVALLAQAQNKSPRLLYIPKKIIGFIAKIGDKLNLPLTTERLEKLTENFVVSNDKIKLVLKKNLPLSAREGISRTARSFIDSA